MLSLSAQSLSGRTQSAAPVTALDRVEIELGSCADWETFAVPGGGPNCVRYLASNHAIEPTPAGARGKLYLLVIDIARDGKPASVNMGSHYDDEWVRTAEGASRCAASSARSRRGRCRPEAEAASKR